MQIEESEQEKLILNVVEEYLNKNRYFDMQEILPFIISRFRMSSVDINIRRIEEILRLLVKKKIIVEGSKLIYRDVLNNKKRNKIYHFILENPDEEFGDYVSEKLSEEKSQYNVEKLTMFGMDAIKNALKSMDRQKEV